MVSIVLLRAVAVRLGDGDLLAGLQGIPATCTKPRARWREPLAGVPSHYVPLLTPVIFFNFIMQVIQAFQEFMGRT